MRFYYRVETVVRLHQEVSIEVTEEAMDILTHQDLEEKAKAQAAEMYTTLSATVDRRADLLRREK